MKASAEGKTWMEENIGCHEIRGEYGRLPRIHPAAVALGSTDEKTWMVETSDAMKSEASTEGYHGSILQP
jgi:hypothetical protein